MRRTFFLSVLGCALIAGCMQRTASTVLPSIAPAARISPASSFRSLYSFNGKPDGAAPWARLTVLDGVLYGTTYSGGADNKGTVFRIEPNGTERLLHSFSGKNGDGSAPGAGLTVHGGVLYGVTQRGGLGGGTLFEIKKSGAERVLYEFTSDVGTTPLGDLAVAGGDFYGTALFGGAHNQGTVFSVTADGHARVLHSFARGSDGARPEAGLESFDGRFYGTTLLGGSHDKGVVFETTQDGEENVLHSFTGVGGDGASPYAKLTHLSGSLYGTTRHGGRHSRGTVFEIKPDGTERVVHSFTATDGTEPIAGPIAHGGLLYGTAYSGGTNSRGTVFELNPSGAFTVLHSFHILGDGSKPRSSLTVLNGKLYGTTEFGGHANLDFGTVYEVTPK